MVGEMQTPSVYLEQTPGVVAHMDDPFGIGWRIANRLRRLSTRRFTRFVECCANLPKFERPIFIIGAPRSGTTMLFHLLRSSSVLGSLPHEGHDVWRMYHHPRLNGWKSDAVGAGEIGWGERRWVSACFGVHTRLNRFVEKTPENCLRILYLLELFPDACFVVLKRNPCDVINSLINGWRHPTGRFRSYYVPEDLSIPGYPCRRRWCFALIDGWRSYKHEPIPEIAFAQYEQCVRGIDAVRSQVDENQWIEIAFEDMVARPEASLAHILQRLGVPEEPALSIKLDQLMANPVNALSPPGEYKWRTQNLAEVQPLLPRLSAMEDVTGYQIDRTTGDLQNLA